LLALGALEGWYLLPRTEDPKAWVPLGCAGNPKPKKKPLPRSGEEVFFGARVERPGKQLSKLA
jgi:hypothetical protein